MSVAVVTVNKKALSASSTPSTSMTSSPVTIKPEPPDNPTTTAAPKSPVVITPSSQSFNIPAPVMLLPQMSLSGLTSGSTMSIIVPPNALNSQRSLLTTSSLNRAISGVRTVTTGGRTITVTSPTTSRLPVENVRFASNSPALTLSLGPKKTANNQQQAQRTVCGLIYNTKVTSTNARGAFVAKKKEFLCNFCQFKTAQYNSFNTHLTYHIFNCHHCTFKAFTRFELINHRQTKHPEFNYELSGFEGLPNLNNFNSDSSSTTTDTSASSTTTSVSATNTAVTMVTSSLSSGTIPTVVTPITIQPESPEDTPVDAPPEPSSTGGETSATETMTTASSSDTSLSVQTTVAPTIITPISPISITPVTSSTSKSPGRELDVGGRANYRMKIVKTLAGKETHTFYCNNPTCGFTCDTLTAINEHMERNAGCRKTTAASLALTTASGSATSTSKSTTSTTSSSAVSTWECFYCQYPSSDQADVVKHLHKEHPGKELKVKRIVRQATSAARSADANKPGATGTTEADCSWGCYYCTFSAADRNKMILHVRSSHPNKKIMITRQRRVTTDGPPTAAAAATPTSPGGESVTSTTALAVSKVAQESSASKKKRRQKKRHAESDDEKDSDYEPSAGRKRSVLYEPSYRPLTESELVSKEETAEQTTITFNEDMKLVTVDFKKNPEVEPQDWDPSTFVIDNKDGVLRCKLCEREFFGARAAPHIKAHITLKHPKPGSLTWMCKYCPFGCQKRDLVMKHLGNKHPDQPLKLVCNEPLRINNVGQIQAVHVVVQEATEMPARTPRTRRNRLVRGDANSNHDDNAHASTQLKPKTLLRGPRCKREKRIRETARYVYRCEDCGRTSVMKSDIVKHITLVHPGKTDLSSSFSKLPRNEVSSETKKANVMVVAIQDMDRYKDLEEVLVTDGDCLMQYMDINDTDTEDDMYTPRPMPKSHKRQRQQQRLVVAEPVVLSPLPKSVSVKESKQAIATEDLSEEVREQLIYEQKIAAEKHKEKLAANRNQNPCFKCTHCDFSGVREIVMKEHILDSHPDKEVALVNLKLIKKVKSKHHVYFCHVRMCNFVSKVRQAVLAHYSKVPSHKPDYLKGEEEGEDGGTEKEGGILAGRGASLRHCARKSRNQQQDEPELEFLYDSEIEEKKGSKSRKRSKKRKATELDTSKSFIEDQVATPGEHRAVEEAADLTVHEPEKTDQDTDFIATEDKPETIAENGTNLDSLDDSTVLKEQVQKISLKKKKNNKKKERKKGSDLNLSEIEHSPMRKKRKVAEENLITEEATTEAEQPTGNEKPTSIEPLQEDISENVTPTPATQPSETEEQEALPLEEKTEKKKREKKAKKPKKISILPVEPMEGDDSKVIENVTEVSLKKHALEEPEPVDKKPEHKEHKANEQDAEPAKSPKRKKKKNKKKAAASCPEATEEPQDLSITKASEIPGQESAEDEVSQNTLSEDSLGHNQPSNAEEKGDSVREKIPESKTEKVKVSDEPEETSINDKAMNDPVQEADAREASENTEEPMELETQAPQRSEPDKEEASESRNDPAPAESPCPDLTQEVPPMETQPCQETSGNSEDDNGDLQSKQSQENNVPENQDDNMLGELPQMQEETEPEMPSLSKEVDNTEEMISDARSNRSSPRKSPVKEPTSLTPQVSDSKKPKKERSPKKSPDEKSPQKGASRAKKSVDSAPPYTVSRHLATDVKVMQYKDMLKRGDEQGLEAVRGLMICRYCPYPSTTNMEEMKCHLQQQHRDAEPMAIDVKMKFQKKSGLIYVCMYDNCSFNTQKMTAFVDHLTTHKDNDLSQEGRGEQLSLPVVPAAEAQPATPVKVNKRKKKSIKTLEASPAGGSAEQRLPRPGSSSKDNSIKNRFSCRKCKDTYFDLTRCKAHILLQHPDLEFFIVIDLHMQRVHKKCKIYLCRQPSCGFVCKDKDEYESHTCDRLNPSGRGEDANTSQKQGCSEMMYQCNYCVFTTTSKEGIEQHMKDEHGGENGYTAIGAQYGSNGEFIMSASKPPEEQRKSECESDGEESKDADTSREDISKDDVDEVNDKTVATSNPENLLNTETDSCNESNCVIANSTSDNIASGVEQNAAEKSSNTEEVSGTTAGKGEEAQEIPEKNEDDSASSSGSDSSSDSSSSSDSDSESEDSEKKENE